MNDPLPDNPDLEWLRKQAKRRLHAIQESKPDAQLSDAQLEIARQYGFDSWRALKAHVEAMTVEPLIASALEQAERSAPVMKASALLSVARVVHVRDHRQALRVLERGIATALSLREPARSIMMGEAFTRAAGVSPAHAFALLGERYDDSSNIPMRLGAALTKMLEQGFHGAVIRHLLSAREEGPEFPFDVMASAMHHAEDDGVRGVLLRKTFGALRHAIGRMRPQLPREMRDVLTVFGTYHGCLPVGEAAGFVRDMARVILDAPDERASISMQDIRFSSLRESLLFELYGTCRRLEPALAESLVAGHRQLAKAVERYPDGSPWAAVSSSESPDEPPIPRREWDKAELADHDYLTLSDAFLPVAKQLSTSFEHAFTIALREYSADTDVRRPNDAPQICWPSTASFRSILYKAGFYEGRAAMRHLERVPDPALRLLAQIELAAALAGLDQEGHTVMHGAPKPAPSPARHEDDESIPEMFAPLLDAPFERKPDIPPSDRAIITPTSLTAGALPTGGSDEDFWVIRGVRLKSVLVNLYDVTAPRIVVPPDLHQQRFDFTLVLPEPTTREVLREKMRAGVEERFRLRRERRSMPVRVLTAPHGITARETTDRLADSGGGFAWGSFDFSQAVTHSLSSPPDFGEMVLPGLMDLSSVPGAPRSFEEEYRAAKGGFLKTLSGGQGMLSALSQSLTIDELCVVLESAFGSVFVDETGTSGAYAIQVESAAGAETFLAALSRETGLAITPATREVEMLVVDA